MRHIIFILLTALLLTTAVSCENWLDVRPKTEVKADDNFDTPQGFKDALTGIYLLMCDQSLYGRELTFGMVDMLGKHYTEGITEVNQYFYINQYNYAETSGTNNPKSTIDPIWNKMYNVIANINNLIDYIEKANKTMFTGIEYNVIRGEAYALRAFIHFDLLRLFGYSYKAGANIEAIPYETKVDNKIDKLSTVSEVITKALADLKIAEEELANDPVIGSKPLVKESTIDDYSYLRTRYLKFNYYAVKLLQARIHLYKADYPEALKAAETVIDQETFIWVPAGEVMTSSAEGRNIVFIQELIFTLNINNLTDIMKTWDNNKYTKTLADFRTVYETEKPNYTYEYRHQYQTRDAGEERWHIKLHQSDPDRGYNNKMPIMRLSEAYYIAAESKLNQGDSQSAVNYLNTVRRARNLIDDLDVNLPVAEVQNEIFKEYAKEFVMEGQLFYYYKRLDSPTIRFHSGGMDSKYYVLPLPDAEIEGRLEK